MSPYFSGPQACSWRRNPCQSPTNRSSDPCRSSASCPKPGKAPLISTSLHCFITFINLKYRRRVHFATDSCEDAKLVNQIFVNRVTPTPQARDVELSSPGSLYQPAAALAAASTRIKTGVTKQTTTEYLYNEELDITASIASLVNMDSQRSRGSDG